MKVKKAVVSILISLPAILLFALTIINIDTRAVSVMYERLGYCCLFAASAWLWHTIDVQKYKTAIKIIVNVVWSVTFTTLIFIINNIFHYIWFNEIFNWVNPSPLLVFMMKDLKYTIGLGTFRYPIVFAAVFLINFLINALKEKGKTISVNQKLKHFFKRKYCIATDDVSYNLDTIIHCYMNDRISDTAIYEYCKSMSSSKEDAEELVECIESFDLPILYETLFEKFEDVISTDVLNKYKERYDKLFI